MDYVQYICTTGGSATRMQRIAPVPKQFVYYKGKQIQQWIRELLQEVHFVGDGDSPTRYHTLLPLAHLRNVCIVDCDVIPFGVRELDFTNDTVLAFPAYSAKYGHITLDHFGKLANVQERGSGLGLKCSGVYYVREMQTLLDRMQHNPNSIADAMRGADVLRESSTIRVGDADDYYNALGLRCYDRDR